MAKNTPSKDPEIESATESEAKGLSDAELERKRRQELRREAKRQQEELRRIEKEMRGPVSRWAKIAMMVIVLLLVAVGIGGWLVYCSYSISLQRDSFAEEYNRADLATLRQFAPAQLGHVEELKRQAENRDGTLNWQQRVAKYREAEEALIKAVTAASDNSAAYETALSRFRILKEEAVTNRLGQYARGLWDQVLEAEASATAQPAQDFSATLATEKLVQAISLLERTAKTYPALRDFDALSTEFRRLLRSVEEKEWERNVPEAWGELQTKINSVGTAQESADWDKASDLCRQAIALIAPALEKIASLKAQAGEAIGIMDEAIRTATAGGMPAAKPDVWTRVTDAAKAARESVVSADYAAALSAAQQANTLLGDAGEKVRQAKASLKATLEQVRALYDTATADSAFMSRNYGAAWQEAQDLYQRIPGLHAQGKTFELVALSADLRQRLDTLIQERDKVSADTRNAEARIEAAAKAPLYVHLARNSAEAIERAEDLRRTAMRRRDRGDLREARDLLSQYADEIERLLKELDSVRSAVLRLRSSLLSRRDRFQEGIRRFKGAEAQTIARGLLRLEQLLNANLYVAAMDLAKEVDGVLPKNRVEPALPGTVVDYEKGLMWIADGNSLDGGNEGKPLDWYAALRWASSRRFAGFDDWRLPTEEELRELSRLPTTERTALFPNTGTGLHWSRLPATDVELALAVDLSSATVSREDKRKPCAVRAVRQPN
jgi:hypothetical protein